MQVLDFLTLPHVVIDGPIDVGIEQRWRIRLAEASSPERLERPALVGQLAPDLARDESIRRRYVRDLERLSTLHVHALAPIVAVGPDADARAPEAPAPWRVRLDPEGTPLSHWLARAPVPIEELSAVFSATADAVHAVHRAGAVLRDLSPEQIVRTPDGRIVLVDVGLARVDVLSSHTASSLLLRGSTHAAPEQLLKTAVDQRSDVYSLGVMMWQALTGRLPFGDGPAFLAERHALPPVSSLRPDVPPVLEALVAHCLRQRPEERPASASEIAWVLRGGMSDVLVDAETTICQHCSTRLRVGQRLCLACGRVAVRFAHAPTGASSWGLELVSLREDADSLRWLKDFLSSVARPPVRTPEFVIGSSHMYSEEERAARIRLPARLFTNLEADTAKALHELMQRQGLRTRLVSPRETRTAGAMVVGSIATMLGGVWVLGMLDLAPWWFLAPGVVLLLVLLANLMNKMSNHRAPACYALRPSPAALPASDPLVARLSSLLQDDSPADVRAVVGELALLVQRLVDHRAALVDTRELEVLTAPVEPIVEAIEQHARQLGTLARELDELDEGAMVRALAASEARGEPRSAREPILEGLDRLRALEDRRAVAFHRLLEAKTLLARTVDLGLAVQDPAREHERDIQLALATLGSGDPLFDRQ
jgi:hypothetical protein